MGALGTPPAVELKKGKVRTKDQYYPCIYEHCNNHHSFFHKVAVFWGYCPAVPLIRSCWQQEVYHNLPPVLLNEQYLWAIIRPVIRPATPETEQNRCKTNTQKLGKSSRTEPHKCISDISVSHLTLMFLQNGMWDNISTFRVGSCSFHTHHRLGFDVQHGTASQIHYHCLSFFCLLVFWLSC